MKNNLVVSLIPAVTFLLLISACEPDSLPPVANAGPDMETSTASNTADLKGSAVDIDGTIVSYQWSKLSGPASYKLVQAASAATKVNDLVEGVYVFQLTVTDDDGLTDTDETAVTVYVPGPWDY
jgi:hypothetical protein